MKISFKPSGSSTKNNNLVYLIDNKVIVSKLPLTKEESGFVIDEINRGLSQIVINRFSQRLFIVKLDVKRKERSKTGIEANKIREKGFNLLSLLNQLKIPEVVLFNKTSNKECTLFFAEGMGLGNYQFLKYKKDKKREKNSLKVVHIDSGSCTRESARELQTILDGVLISKNLVNEPLSFLTAIQLSKEIQKIGKSCGLKVEVFNKAKIQTLKMGGLLAVNKGSSNPPTFSIMEWKPKNTVNKAPIVLVGKGIVYDTGGLSLKPTPNSMDQMKSDMAGAAAVIGGMYTAAKSKIPLHIIGLIPATENRPGYEAYTPGDIITMHDKSTVEVLNTDAEGRMILADALSFAKQFNPELVIDIATLTGSAAKAIGHHGTVFMGTAEEKVKKDFIECGDVTFERLVEFPLWDEYQEMLKSDIADIKNVGGDSSGAITAGIFLKHFIDYPWLHFDIAGTAYLSNEDSYRGKYSTGVGVRLFYHYFRKRAGQ